MNKLPHNPEQRHHAWSDDPARDRAVRLAEDGVTERPTLEEASACLTAERDAAIRERDEARKSWLRSEESGTRLLAERNAALDYADGLRQRVAELEAASGGNGQGLLDGSAQTASGGWEVKAVIE